MAANGYNVNVLDVIHIGFRRGVQGNGYNKFQQSYNTTSCI